MQIYALEKLIKNGAKAVWKYLGTLEMTELVLNLKQFCGDITYFITGLVAGGSLAGGILHSIR